jgi:membrane protease YdiL (CAAX protease family)
VEVCGDVSSSSSTASGCHQLATSVQTAGVGVTDRHERVARCAAHSLSDPHRICRGVDMSLCMTDTAPPGARDADIWKALALVVAFAAWNAISDVIYEHLGLDAVSRASPLRITLIVVGILVTCGIIVGLGCVVWARRSLASLGWRAPSPVRLVLLGLGLTALLFAGVFGIVAALGGKPGVEAFTSAIVNMPASDRLFFAIMGAKVAFAEETVFRGLLQTSFAERLGPVAAVVLTSVIFGLYHRAVFPIPLLLMKMALGLLLGVSALASRSLVPSWMAHSLLWGIAGDN